MHQMKRILLVEDSLQDAELVIEALEECKLTNSIVHLRDGAEALDYLHRRGQFAQRENDLPAVVMLDLKMPKVDGLEVLQNMKNDPVLKVVPVVIMTSSREERDLHESYRSGVNAYVVKPVQFHEFVEAIRHLGFFWAMLNEPPLECR
jgi:two-component system, response regulator